MNLLMSPLQFWMFKQASQETINTNRHKYENINLDIYSLLLKLSAYDFIKF